jgi:hypothetical protein
LYLEKGTGAVASRIAGHKTARLRIDNTWLPACTILSTLSHILLNQLGQKHLSVVSDYDVHPWNRRHLMFPVLCKTTYHGYHCRRVLRTCLADGIPALFFCDSGHCTGVYDVQIRFFFIRHNVKPGIRKLALQMTGFSKV